MKMRNKLFYKKCVYTIDKCIYTVYNFNSLKIKKVFIVIYFLNSSGRNSEFRPYEPFFFKSNFLPYFLIF